MAFNASLMLLLSGILPAQLAAQNITFSNAIVASYIDGAASLCAVDDERVALFFDRTNSMFFNGLSSHVNLSALSEALKEARKQGQHDVTSKKISCDYVSEVFTKYENQPVENN